MVVEQKLRKGDYCLLYLQKAEKQHCSDIVWYIRPRNVDLFSDNSSDSNLRMVKWTSRHHSMGLFFLSVSELARDDHIILSLVII